MAYTGPGFQLSGKTKIVEVEWEIRYKAQIAIPEELSLDPLLLEEYFGVSGDLNQHETIENLQNIGVTTCNEIK